MLAAILYFRFLKTPPQTWGKIVHKSYQARNVGNTPTCVGKTGAAWGRRGDGQNPPHMRGEDSVILLYFFIIRAFSV